ncbi:MAG: serine/threonine protein kinase [Coriobacteriales bacterium]
MAVSAENESRRAADRSELREILSAFSDDGLIVEKVLKESEWERTELVSVTTERPGLPQQRCIRKTIRHLDGRRSAYETVFEAQAQGFSCIHVPRILDCRRLGDDLVVMMEESPGETLEALVAREGGSEELAIRVFPEVCEAVRELHLMEGGPIIHRDIKPSNIMVRDGMSDSVVADGHAGAEQGAPPVSIIDLGIARTYRDDAPADTQRLGTPGYAPPEQFGYGQTGVSSDVYALGMLLYFCLTGEEPSASLREGDVPFADAPARYRPVLAKATEFDPKARYASVEELREAFLAPPDESKDGSLTGTPRRTPQFRVVGAIWDVLLAGAFVFSLVTTINAIWNAPGAISDVPFGIRFITYLLISPVLCGALAYAVADRRPLRQYLAFCRKLSLLQETLVCIFIIVVALIAIAFIWIIGTP